MKAEAAEVTKKKTSIYKLVGFLLVIILFILTATLYWFSTQLSPVNPQAGEKIIKIPPGSTTAEIGKLLKKEGIIRNEKIFTLYAKYSGLDKKLQAGEYVLSGAKSLHEIIAQLAEGKVVFHSFTVPEGYNAEQIAELLHSKGLADKERFLYLVRNGDFKIPFLDKLPDTEYRLEGFLFPDTYKIPLGFKEEQIIQMMIDRFLEVFNTKLRNKAREVGISPYKAVILASIIEREAMVSSEKNIISAVFHNRMKKGMLLQSCATVLYALGEKKEELLGEDLKVESPYNTYLHAGLPPGPISNPGKESLQAAVMPADVNYLYFVAKGDGTHHFSYTHSEHVAAKNKYLK